MSHSILTTACLAVTVIHFLLDLLLCPPNCCVPCWDWHSFLGLLLCPPNCRVPHWDWHSFLDLLLCPSTSRLPAASSSSLRGSCRTPSVPCRTPSMHCRRRRPSAGSEGSSARVWRLSGRLGSRASWRPGQRTRRRRPRHPVTGSRWRGIPQGGRLASAGYLARAPLCPERVAETHGRDVALQVQDRNKLLDQLWGDVLGLHGTMLAAGAKTGLATSR